LLVRPARKATIMIDDERLIDIEIKLARQEDLVDTLNTQVYRQQKRIDELGVLCETLARHVAALTAASQAGNTPAHEIPPHY
jgi:SlyX protein